MGGRGGAGSNPAVKPPASVTWRLLAKCHERRNLAEYEGVVDVDERLCADLMAAAEAVKSAVTALPPPSPERE
jgi:hypothetical protein